MTLSGYLTGIVPDPARSNWDNTGPRPIAWSAWYPAQSGPPPERLSLESFFDLGPIAWNARPRDGGRCPTVLLSHGTGGTAESLGWLAQALVAQGFIVLGVNHHGNTGLEGYKAEGFVCWWERAADLSVALSALADEGVLKYYVDVDRVAAVGFSLGCHSVLSLAGLRSSLPAFHDWRASAGIIETGPREFPDAFDQVADLQASSPAFRASMDRQGADFSDPRVKAVVAIAAPPPVQAFLPDAIAACRVPVTLITGGQDKEAPAAHGADWLIAQNPGFARHD